MKIKSKLLLVLCLMFLTCKVNALECNNKSYVNNHGIEITCNQLKNLLNLGFNEKEIAYMDQDEFDANVNLIGEVVSETVKYYKTTTYYPNSTSLLSMNNFEPVSFSEEVSFDEYEFGETVTEISELDDGETVITYKK